MLFPRRGFLILAGAVVALPASTALAGTATDFVRERQTQLCSTSGAARLARRAGASLGTFPDASRNRLTLPCDSSPAWSFTQRRRAI